MIEKRVFRVTCCGIAGLFLVMIAMITILMWAEGTTEAALIPVSRYWLISAGSLFAFFWLGYYAFRAEFLEMDLDRIRKDPDSAADLADTIERLKRRAEDSHQGGGFNPAALVECTRQLQVMQRITDFFDNNYHHYQESGVVQDSYTAIRSLARKFEDNVQIVCNLYEVILDGGISDDDEKNLVRRLNRNQELLQQASELQLVTVRYVNSVFHEGELQDDYYKDIIGAFNYAMQVKVDQTAVNKISDSLDEINRTIADTKRRLEPLQQVL